MLALLLVLLAQLSLVSSSLNFLALGDWGGQDSSPFYTQAQWDAAQGMQKVAQRLDAQFVVNVGDSFYEDGVSSVQDERFRTTFEDVYAGPALQVPWYTIGGNHDYRGNITAQIEYSSVSKRWTYPSLYHSHSFTADDGTTLDLIMIDTVDMASLTHKRPHEEGYFDPLPLRSRSFASKQWDWLETKLKESKADHVLVVGHYPVYSVCKHGNTPTLIELLMPLLVEHHAHYLSGHDHCMEHLLEPNTPVHYFLTGMGVECCYKGSNQKKVPAGALQWYVGSDNNVNKATAGFTAFEMNANGLRASFYDQSANLLHSSEYLPARSLAQKQVKN